MRSNAPKRSARSICFTVAGTTRNRPSKRPRSRVGPKSANAFGNSRGPPRRRDSAIGGPREFPKAFADFGPTLERGRFDGLFRVVPATVKQIERALRFGALLRIESVAAKADHIQTRHAVDLRSDDVRRKVFSKTRDALANRIGAHTDELVEDGASAREDIIANRRVPGDEHVV